MLLRREGIQKLVRSRRYGSPNFFFPLGFETNLCVCVRVCVCACVYVLVWLNETVTLFDRYYKKPKLAREAAEEAKNVRLFRRGFQHKFELLKDFK